jgi:hypothetical protein
LLALKNKKIREDNATLASSIQEKDRVILDKASHPNDGVFELLDKHNKLA